MMRNVKLISLDEIGWNCGQMDHQEIIVLFFFFNRISVCLKNIWAPCKKDRIEDIEIWIAKTWLEKTVIEYNLLFILYI